MRLQNYYLGVSTLCGFGGAVSWGHQAYQKNKNMTYIAIYSIHGFLFYSMTWILTVPLNLKERLK